MNHSLINLNPRLEFARSLTLGKLFGTLDPGTKQQMYELTTRLWQEEKITVFIVSRGLKEAFTLAARVLTFDNVRIDPGDTGVYGATITFDLPLAEKSSVAGLSQMFELQQLGKLARIAVRRPVTTKPARPTATTLNRQRGCKAIPHHAGLPCLYMVVSDTPRQ
jgi:energy-coupling factor transporter ATP-binding protein EcfA2